MNWPDPDAPRAAVDAFVREQNPPPPPVHEAPEGAPVCRLCKVVRVTADKPFCKPCTAVVDAVGRRLS